MKRLFLAAALLASVPSFAADLASRPAEDFPAETPLRGIYGALGGGATIILVPGDDTFGYDAEARVGYSFNPALQLYLSGAVDGGSLSGVSFKTYQVDAFVQYHLLAKSAVMVYVRGGIGVGISADGFGGATAAGLAEAGGLGVEFRVAPNIFLAPEFFYRNANLSANGIDQRIQVVGLQLGLVYY
jgi:hypothetical protein